MLKSVEFIVVFATAMFVSLFSAEKYAILMAGWPAPDYSDGSFPKDDGPNSGSQDDAFWNDLFLMWEMLTQEMGYNNDNVYVLYPDQLGHDYPETEGGAWVPDRYRPNQYNISRITKYPATEENFFEVARILNEDKLLTEDDFLFVWVHSHGNVYENEGFFNVLHGAVSASDMAEHFNLLRSKKIYCMAQCLSGSFGEILTNGQENVYFLSSTMPNQVSNIADDRYRTYYYPFDPIPSPISGVECEVITNSEGANLKMVHSEFDFHLYSSSVGKKPDSKNYYYGNPMNFPPTFTLYFSEVDGYIHPEIFSNTLKDGVMTIEESRLWLDWQETESEEPLCIDNSNIGPFTSLKYPTLILNEFDDPSSYLFTTILRGIMAVSENIDIQNTDLNLFSNSHTTVLPNISVTTYPGWYINLGENSVLLFEENSKLIIDNDVQIQFGTGSELIFKSGSELVLKNGADIAVFNHLIFEEGAKITVEGNARITGNQINIPAYSNLTIQSGVKLRIGSYKEYTQVWGVI